MVRAKITASGRWTSSVTNAAVFSDSRRFESFRRRMDGMGAESVDWKWCHRAAPLSRVVGAAVVGVDGCSRQ